MLDQVTTWKSKGISCAALGRTDEIDYNTMIDIKNGNINLLFSSPEAILSDYGRELLSQPYKDRLCMLAFDEAHCIIEWGEDFRPLYKEVSLLRSIASQCPVLTLTATCTQKMMNDILTHLLLSKQPVETVAVLPDRPNLMLHIKRTKTFEKELDWYITKLRDHGVAAPKAIIYCRSMTQAADVYAYIMHKIGSQAWLTPNNKDPSKRLLDMYHRSSPSVDQKRVTVEFPKEDSSIRCVIATIAFGMGVQVSDVRYIFHWGASKTPLSYWQEIGRCCRDGEQGHCYLFLTPNSLHPQRVDEEMIKICKDDTKCLRVSILEHLTVTGMDISSLALLQKRSPCDLNCNICKRALCFCCSRCQFKCKCSNV